MVFGSRLSVQSWALFRSVSNLPNACQLPSLENDRDTSTTAVLFIPNMLLIREAALLGVTGREGREAEMLVCRRALTAHGWVFQQWGMSCFSQNVTILNQLGTLSLIACPRLMADIWVSMTMTSKCGWVGSMGGTREILARFHFPYYFWHTSECMIYWPFGCMSTVAIQLWEEKSINAHRCKPASIWLEFQRRPNKRDEIL